MLMRLNWINRFEFDELFSAYIKYKFSYFNINYGYLETKGTIIHLQLTKLPNKFGCFATQVI